MGGGLENLGNSCYISVTIQCLAYIPDLTRLLLENDYFKDLPKSTFLSRFISLLRLLFKENESKKLQRDEKDRYLKKFALEKQLAVRWFYDNRTTLDEDFEGRRHQDAMEFFTKLFTRFSLESKPFEIAHHLLFSAYSKISKFCENGHESNNFTMGESLLVELDDPDEVKNKEYHLTNLINIYLSRQETNRFNCPVCNNNNNEKQILKQSFTNFQ